MPIDRERARQYLKSFDFRHLFLDQLGWDKHAGSLEKVIDGKAYRFQAVSEKRGVVALVSDSIPDYSTRAKLDKLIAKDHFEHLIVFTDQPHGRQVWQWVRRESGRPNAIRAYTYSAAHSGELLLQKLEHLVVTLEEEEQTRLADVLGRMKAGFDVEKVTKKFYERFKSEHDRFLRLVDGIPDEQMEAWYVSVMINRLMFLYFIQAKSFLNGDQDYLRNKLKESRDRKKDGYYRDFLCPLFFEGFARKKEERSAAVNKLLGTVPYLNGGLFQRHQIEELHGKKIQVPDIAFAHLFDFFKDYNWHLDDREAREDNEINPDVLGYIFEKYINQKQMGAYYTKEDITEYISKNTIIPFLLDAARKDCTAEFDKSGGVWRLLQDDPDRYINVAVRHGAGLDLPANIAVGISSVKKRTGWNKPAPSEYALPTEAWREVVERRRRYEEVRNKLVNGKVSDVNDLITLNLDVRQFAQDVIQFCEGPNLLRALYKAISKVSVLDPTCGSGAFLFAALNILKPLYEACLQRMQMFVDELDAGPEHHPKTFDDFRQVLEESKQHPKQDYFILKSIIVNNLYGVDIMEEAVEICKLRLFLKLVAQVDSQDRIEPLPDIDFNIRVGNTLVGYARYSDVEKAVGGKLDFENAMGRIEDKAKKLDSAVEMFRKQQTRLHGSVTIEDKLALRARFDELEAELNDSLAAEYGIKVSGMAAWTRSHRPFHWFSDFHQIISHGGFDVIIGNPPYVECTKIRDTYNPKGLLTASSGNLFGMITEVAFKILGPSSRLGVIIPMSVVSTARMESVRHLILSHSDVVHLSHYSGNRNPSVLFEGVEMRLTICFAKTKRDASRPVSLQAFSTEFRRWASTARTHLFATTSYVQVPPRFHSGSMFPKCGSETEEGILQKILDASGSSTLGIALVSDCGNNVYAHRIASYFVKGLTFVPRFASERDGAKRSEDYKVFSFANRAHTSAACCVINSSLFYLYYIVFSDAYHCGRELIEQFPVNISRLSAGFSSQIRSLEESLMRDLKKNSDIRKIAYKNTGLVEMQKFFPKLSKPILDEIDTLLVLQR